MKKLLSPEYQFLLDENVSRNLKKILESKGYKAITVQELNKQNIKNNKLIDLARVLQSILITCDKEFLYYSYLPTDSIILINIYPLIDENVLPAFERLLNKASLSDLKGNLIILYENNYKISSKRIKSH